MSRRLLSVVLVLLLFLCISASPVAAAESAHPLVGYEYLMRLFQVAQEAGIYLDTYDNNIGIYTDNHLIFIQLEDVFIYIHTNPVTACIQKIGMEKELLKSIDPPPLTIPYIEFADDDQPLNQALAIAMLYTSPFEYWQNFTVPKGQALEQLKEDALARYATIMKALETESSYSDDFYSYHFRPDSGNPKHSSLRIEPLSQPPAQ